MAVAQRAAAAGDRVGELSARLSAGVFKLYTEPEGAAVELEETAAEALPELEAAGDHLALHIAHFARAQVAHYRSHFDDEVADLDLVMYHAQQSGLPHLVAWSVPAGGAARFYGTTPLQDVLAWLTEREAQFGSDWRLASNRANVLALLGRFDEARMLESEFARALEERGDTLNLGSRLSQSATVLELLAGDPAAAAELAERGCRMLEEAGESAWLSTGSCWYAEALYALGKLDEAEEWAQKGKELGGRDDATTQIQSRVVRAKVLARRGLHAEAERMAREGVVLADDTQSLIGQADARRDLAEVLELAGRREEATAVLREALERYERKGALVPAERARERLAALEPASA
jgi:tetratricopeptide (TPR) repeat protein